MYTHAAVLHSHVNWADMETGRSSQACFLAQVGSSNKKCWRRDHPEKRLPKPRLCWQLMEKHFMSSTEKARERTTQAVMWFVSSTKEAKLTNLHALRMRVVWQKFLLKGTCNSTIYYTENTIFSLFTEEAAKAKWKSLRDNFWKGFKQIILDQETVLHCQCLSGYILRLLHFLEILCSLERHKAILHLHQCAININTVESHENKGVSWLLWDTTFEIHDPALTMH